MTYVYLICFLLSVIAVICLLGLTPEGITTDLMKFVSPKQTLRDKVLAQKGRKKSRKLTVELNRIRDALITTGKGGQFTRGMRKDQNRFSRKTCSASFVSD